MGKDYRVCWSIEMSRNEVSTGNRVKVIDSKSLFFGRTGLIAGRGEDPKDSSRRSKDALWQVVFDWPLGGLAGRSVIKESSLGLAELGESRDPRLEIQRE
ncbi:MAG: hypothetical protein DK304_000665 [Chloroflexi bacterium]|nr:MAG: hypothetical protein DK304_000665 [Chloroflexota bacterium]